MDEGNDDDDDDERDEEDARGGIDVEVDDEDGSG